MKTNPSIQVRNILRTALLGAATVWIASTAILSAQTITNVTVPQGSLSLTGRLYRPAGDGPFPAVIVMHGSGGMWSDDNESKGMISHLQEWGTLLQNNGYVGLFIDSFKPRGIPGDFKSKRPCFDPAWDEAKCAPAYERPKDAYAALTWLRNQILVPVRDDRIGLVGFSHGGEAALAAVVSSTITKNPWKLSYVTAWQKDAKGNIIKDVNGVPKPGTYNHNYQVPAPYKPWIHSVIQGINGPFHLSFPVPESHLFACVVAYYPGCGFSSYFGSVSSEDAGNYMPYVKTLVLHGTEDDLWKSGYPGKLLKKSIAQATALGVNNVMTQITYEGAKHSFDTVAMAAQSDWDTANESDDQYAKRVAREDALDHLDATLKAP